MRNKLFTLYSPSGKSVEAAFVWLCHLLAACAAVNMTALPAMAYIIF
jgi:hypothetical protein